MSLFFRSTAVVFAAAATGCSTLTPYEPAGGEAMVPVRMIGMGQPQMCKGGKLYALPMVGDTDVAKVPAGQRISIGSRMSFSGYNVTYSCNPWISFVPDGRQAYVSNSGLKDQRCFIELVRTDPAKDTGVALEPSVGPSNCVLAPAARASQPAP